MKFIEITYEENMKERRFINDKQYTKKPWTNTADADRKKSF